MAAYVLLLFHVLTITPVSLSFAEDIVIFNSPPLIYRRDYKVFQFTWGEWENCDKGEYAFGARAIVEDNFAIQDAVAVVGVCIYCAPLGQPPGSTENSGKCSSVAKPKTYKITYRFDCPHLVTGFQVANDKPSGVRYNDGVGVLFGITTVKFFCSTGEEKEYDSYEKRPYTDRANCLAGQAVCGIRTQVDPEPQPKGQEKAGLVNVQLKCCDIVTPGLVDRCTASDKWLEVKSCDNVKGSKPMECKYETSFGTTKATMSSQTKKMMKALEAAESTFDRYNANSDLIGLKSDFATIGGETTGYDWSKESPETFESMTTTNSKVIVPGGIHTTIFQVVGTCGLYTVYSSTIVRVDTKDSGPAPAPKVLPSGFLCDKNSTTTGTNIPNPMGKPDQRLPTFLI